MKVFFCMKWFFSSLFFFVIFFLSVSTAGLEVLENYNVSTKGLKIGELVWELKNDGNDYTIKITLKNKGLVSSVYKFNGEYFSSGKVNNGVFVSQNYSHKWVTKKKKKEMHIVFDNNKVVFLDQLPKELEEARIDYFGLNQYSDPLTSFINILNNNAVSKTIDGRRVYDMVLENNLDKLDEKKIIIKKYINIWADHKRNDLSKIVFIKEQNLALPRIVKIYFKGSVFKIYKN